MCVHVSVRACARACGVDAARSVATRRPQVPCDCVVASGSGVRCDEAALTGESTALAKAPATQASLHTASKVGANKVRALHRTPFIAVVASYPRNLPQAVSLPPRVSSFPLHGYRCFFCRYKTPSLRAQVHVDPFLFAGSTLQGGSCAAVALVVGSKTQYGKIMVTVSGGEEGKTPLAVRLDELAEQIGQVRRNV